MIIDASPPVFRFAPSPNGALHLGHAYSAMLNFDMAQQMGGRFLVRVEDIDQTRCTPELETAMLDDLRWLGLDWEAPPRRQSDHFADYKSALNQLDTKGLTYRSALSRGDINRIVDGYEARSQTWPRDPDGAPLFPGRDYEADNDIAGTNFAVRLDMTEALRRVGNLSWTEVQLTGKSHIVQADAAKWGDVVLARRDAPTSYHLAVVVDDALQGVTHIVRGSDLYEATAVHALLRELLGLPKTVYHHHRLVLDDAGSKLSKSRGHTSLASLRDAGMSAADIRRIVGL